jgi:DNA-binding LytR/AlgR family response regulator
MVMNISKKVLVVEDDGWQRATIKKVIEEVDACIVVHTAKTYIEAMTIAKQETIDLFIFDIDLKDDINGIELAKIIRKQEKYALTWMIFLTIDTRFELEAYKSVHCYEYIGKPYKKEKIQSLVKRLLITGASSVPEINQPAITVETIQSTMKFFIDDIIFIEARGRGVEINTIDGKHVLGYTSLKKINCLLEPHEQFAKTHRSFIVNIKYVKSIKRLSSRQSEITFILGDRQVILSDKNRKIVEEKLVNQ